MDPNVWENPNVKERLVADWDEGRPDLDIMEEMAFHPPAGLQEDLPRLWCRTAYEQRAAFRYVLDVGCGTGRAAKKKFAHRYRGFDSSRLMVKHCSDLGLDVEWASIWELPLPDNHSDLVICNACLFHIGDWAEAVHELWRVTKYRLIFSTYWRFGIPGVTPHTHVPQPLDNKKQGTTHIIEKSIVPTWQIRRFIRKKLDPAPIGKKIQWYKQVGKEKARVAFVLLDKAPPIVGARIDDPLMKSKVQAMEEV